MDAVGINIKSDNIKDVVVTRSNQPTITKFYVRGNLVLHNDNPLMLLKTDGFHDGDIIYSRKTKELIQTGVCHYDEGYFHHLDGALQFLHDDDFKKVIIESKDFTKEQKKVISEYGVFDELSVSVHEYKVECIKTDNGFEVAIPIRFDAKSKEQILYEKSKES